MIQSGVGVIGFRREHQTTEKMQWSTKPVKENSGVSWGHSRSVGHLFEIFVFIAKVKKIFNHEKQKSLMLEC